MELLKKRGSNYTIELSSEELAIVSNALNEARNSIDSFEFFARIGGEISEVSLMIKKISSFFTAVDGSA